MIVLAHRRSRWTQLAARRARPLSAAVPGEAGWPPAARARYLPPFPV